MDKRKRTMIEGWTDKAGSHLQAGREHIKSYYRYSECIEACQECTELSTKAVLEMLGIDYSATHGWDKKQIDKIASQIRERQIIEKLAEQHLESSVPLPRLLFLANFWSQFYLLAKYGFEAGHLASAQELFRKEDADLALQHAGECHRAASALRYLPEEKLSVIVAEHPTEA